MSETSLIPSSFSNETFESWFEDVDGVEMCDIEHLAKLTGRRKDSLVRTVQDLPKIFKGEYIEISTSDVENPQNTKKKVGRRSKRLLLTKRGSWLLSNELDYRKDPVDVQLWIVGFKKYCVDCGIAVQEGKVVIGQEEPERVEATLKKRRFINSERRRFFFAANKAQPGRIKNPVKTMNDIWKNDFTIQFGETEKQENWRDLLEDDSEDEQIQMRHQLYNFTAMTHGCMDVESQNRFEKKMFELLPETMRPKFLQSQIPTTKQAHLLSTTE